MAYKTKCYAITFGVHYNGSQYGYNQVVSYNTLGFTMYQTVGTNGLAIMWIALGVQQWGFSSGNGAADITFPITFGTLYSITQGFCNSGSVNNWNWAISSYSVSKFHVIGKGGIGLFWIAVGKAQQWGLSDNIQRQTITFPISFPKICYHITWTATSSAGNPYKTSGYVNSVTNISFLARADDTACQKYWFAVGV